MLIKLSETIKSTSKHAQTCLENYKHNGLVDSLLGVYAQIMKVKVG